MFLFVVTQFLDGIGEVVPRFSVWLIAQNLFKLKPGPKFRGLRESKMTNYSLVKLS